MSELVPIREQVGVQPREAVPAPGVWAGGRGGCLSCVYMRVNSHPFLCPFPPSLIGWVGRGSVTSTH